MSAMNPFLDAELASCARLQHSLPGGLMRALSPPGFGSDVAWHLCGKNVMATEIITGGISGTHSELATVEEIRRAFTLHRKELTWLAGFLTSDHIVAEACVVDASFITEAQGEVSQEDLSRWARLATITSALQIEESRIAQLAPLYECRACDHQEHPGLRLQSISFVVEKADLIQSRLDVLCRFALILCGVEKCSSSEAARLLRISRSTVEAAYCAALEWLDVMQCQALLESCGCCAYN